MASPAHSYGLTEEQCHALFAHVANGLNQTDEREQHFILLVITREDDSDDTEEAEDDGNQLVSTNLISSLPADGVQDAMRNWLNRKTQ